MKKQFQTIPLLLAFMVTINAGCKTPPKQRINPEDYAITRHNAETLVIVHSRTGNTAQMALAISNSLKTDYIRLRVPEDLAETYLSFPGRATVLTIIPDKLNLSQYKLLFLGSPIWGWHPTAVIYSFIKKNNLQGKNVVLFYSYRGGISDDAIPEWKKLVSSRGGSVIDVIGINCKKLKGKTVLDAAKDIIARKRGQWK
jgi:flavodoxin